jgi:hypothetical protein
LATILLSTAKMFRRKPFPKYKHILSSGLKWKKTKIDFRKGLGVMAWKQH